MTDGDEALVRLAQSGDRRAFEQLLARTWRLVYARLYPDTDCRSTLQDLVQETYLLAWRRIGQLDDPAHFRPWLLAVAHTVLLDAARSRGRRKRSGRHEPPERLQQLPTAGPGPLDQAQHREARDRLLDALRDLPERYRVPLTLRFLMDADYDTIAAQLALSNGSLRGLLHRGMQMLRTRLKEEA